MNIEKVNLYATPEVYNEMISHPLPAKIDEAIDFVGRIIEGVKNGQFKVGKTDAIIGKLGLCINMKASNPAEDSITFIISDELCMGSADFESLLQECLPLPLV